MTAANNGPMLCRADVKHGRITGEVIKVNRGAGRKNKEITTVLIRILGGQDAYNAGKIIKRHVKKHNVYFDGVDECQDNQQQQERTQAISP
jgi:ribosomal protein S28E/S33